ncbi:MAG: UPF0182 family protein [Armatimonadetes bacterium]|nr:UPF0182 family protein [Armatimonadota bacterium]
MKSYLIGMAGRGGARRAALLTLIGLFAALVLFGPQLVALYTDWLWFLDAGYRSVFLRTTLIKVELMLAAAAVFFTILYANLRIARFAGDRPRLYLDERHEFRVALGDISRRSVSILLLVSALVISLTVGLAAAVGWYDFLLFRNAVPFPDSDPLFGRNAAFYVFRLPFLRFLYRWVMLAVILSAIGAALVYFVDRAVDIISGDRTTIRIEPRARAHLSALLGIALLVKAWGYWLARYELPFAQQRLFSGAGYTDVHVRLPALALLTVLAVMAGLVLLANIRFRSLRAPLFALAAWLAVSVTGGVVLPAAVQKLRVTPNELTAEQPFIRHNIQATRTAFNLHAVTQHNFPADSNLTAADIRANGDTVRNIRLWDYGPLLEAYRQIQTIRSYYAFENADVDRYRFPDGVRQVALSVRELKADQLAGAESSWINRHLIYTHGYGLCMSPVDRVAPGGLPELIIKDFPPQAPPGLEITRPQIYFGELTDDYVIVGSTEKEFDYPSGDENVTTAYAGKAGVSLAGMGRRLAFAARFGDANIILSGHINENSRILFARNIRERVQRIAPFLRLDGDPYPVVRNGGIVWILDAYTTTRWYPYSRQVPVDQQQRVLNYMRNSVKVTVDAFDGTVHFYLADPEDPVAAGLGRAFPGLFRPLSEMPEDLRGHLRYPEDLFNVQSFIYGVYHMTDPRVFYNREDMWHSARPKREVKDTLTGQNRIQEERPMRPYYVIMELPDGDRAEYILMLPFTPIGDKQNMIAWMAARNDGEHLGKLVVYKFPKQKLVYGPYQVDALIDQLPQISEKLSLWDRAGSKVNRAPVMAIPIEESLLYVEPLYLQAERSQMPELKQVIVAYAGQVVMADNLQAGLAAVFGGDVGAGSAVVAAVPGAEPAAPAPPAGTPPAAARPSPAPPAAGGTPVTPRVRQLIGEADGQYRRAQDALRRGDWAAYGAEMKRLSETLGELKRAAGE